MIGAIWTLRCTRLGLGVATALVAVASLATLSPQAQARAWVAVGAPCCGSYWAPGPYYAYPPPYAYAPPPGYYPPPPAEPSAYSASTPPSAYSSEALPAYSPAPANASAAAFEQSTPAITYTNKPAFKNAAGQTCRQYKATDTTGAHPIDVFGTACQAADGQWRVTD